MEMKMQQSLSQNENEEMKGAANHAAPQRILKKQNPSEGRVLEMTL
jgi:hypothetical protein